jgi:hypothetical protein
VKDAGRGGALLGNRERQLEENLNTAPPNTPTLQNCTGLLWSFIQGKCLHL